MQLPSLEEIHNATQLVRAVMPPTPQYSWPLLNARSKTEVWVKHENHSPVGAFKLRGALVYMDWLKKTQPAVKGVIGATRGNHGQGVALAASRLELTSVIVVPHGNSREKNRAMRSLGAELIEHGDDFQAALEYSRNLAETRRLHPVPSFHPLLVHGTATYALEFLKGAPGLDAVYVPIGLGSSICGMIAVRNALGLKSKIIGVVAEDAPAYAVSFREKKAVSAVANSRLADGLSCRVPVPEALEIMLANVDHIVEVSEGEIATAMRAYYEDTHNVAEGAAGAGLAALLKERDALCGKRAGVVLTGGNVDRELFLDTLKNI
ncbi:threonine dehydratase [Alloacidobacterium sp.]|uniref:threonine dehydratase n=1 Tax=Alloacidobacterium sp. TaxID=2951999 RepID=UPI002D6B7377|nr:threonine dehydratase [Alloacidobacterium sp.]HYK34448.1 threonine dehydratase [Alloacidobacterium sp.]